VPSTFVELDGFSLEQSRRVNDFMAGYDIDEITQKIMIDSA